MPPAISRPGFAGREDPNRPAVLGTFGTTASNLCSASCRHRIFPGLHLVLLPDLPPGGEAAGDYREPFERQMQDPSRPSMVHAVGRKRAEAPRVFLRGIE